VGSKYIIDHKNEGFRYGNPGVDVAAYPFEQQIGNAGKMNPELVPIEDRGLEWQKRMEEVADQANIESDGSWLTARARGAAWGIPVGAAWDTLMYASELGGTQENKHGDPKWRSSCKDYPVGCIVLGVAALGIFLGVYLSSGNLPSQASPYPRRPWEPYGLDTCGVNALCGQRRK
jgi:hypothetical protein